MSSSGSTMDGVLLDSLSRRSTSLLDQYVQEFQRVLEHDQARLALQNEQALRRADALTRRIVEESFDPVIALDDKRRIVMANRAAHQMFGYEDCELVGRTIEAVFPKLSEIEDLVGDDGQGEPKSGALNEEASAHRRSFEIETRSGDGRDMVIEISWSVLQEAGPARHVLIARDISALKAQENWLRHQARHDALTGLPNRAYLSEAIDQAVERLQDLPDEHLLTRTQKNQAILLLLDLDKFKDVNDTLGHHVGDRVLVDFAQRLLKVAGEDDLVARLGGDEFAVLLPARKGLEAAWSMAERIVASVRDPFVLDDGFTPKIGTSVGIAMLPEHATDRATLLQRADVAMYAAKRGESSIAVYNPTVDPNSVRQLAPGGDVRLAVRDREFKFELQPQLDIRSGKILRAEALLRWHHPTRGLIPPDQFVPQSESSGLIHEITQWSVVEAVRMLAEWKIKGLNIDLALNLSARSFDDHALACTVLDRLSADSVDPSRLTIEVTESVMLETPGPAVASIQALSDAGVNIALDDFGTGFSSLTLLRRLPIDELKIDQIFVHGLCDNRADRKIISSTIALAHDLGLIAVAEGVEHKAQLDILADLNCDIAQGYLIAPSMSVDRFENQLSEGGFLGIAA